MWSGFYAAALANATRTTEQAIACADKGIIALRERMRPMPMAHHDEDRHAQREADELKAKTR